MGLGIDICGVVDLSLIFLGLRSLKYMSGFEIGVSNICLGLNSFVLKFH